MVKQVSEMTVAEIISAAIGKVRDFGQPTREQALVITKLQEALHWQHDYEVALKDAARRAGVGPSVRGPGQPGNPFPGIQLTEPIDLPNSTTKPPSDPTAPSGGETNG